MSVSRYVASIILVYSRHLLRFVSYKNSLLFRIYATEALDVVAPQNVLQKEIAKVEISFPWLGVRPIVLFVLSTLYFESTKYKKYNFHSDIVRPR